MPDTVAAVEAGIHHEDLREVHLAGGSHRIGLGLGLDPAVAAAHRVAPVERHMAQAAHRRVQVGRRRQKQRSCLQAVDCNKGYTSVN